MRSSWGKTTRYENEGHLPARTLALYDLARLEEDAGDLENARRHYREFLDRWGDADMPISPP
jgi:hypothetical protein